MHINPADYVIKAFGGVRATARQVGRTGGAVCQWRTRGKIPGGMQIKILELAKEQGLDITADDLINGKELPDDNL